jgi:DNA-binding transcriptional MerR regulator
VRSLRFYEDEGLIVPGRCRNGYRDFCRSTVDRVVIIRSLLNFGLPIRLVRQVLPHLAAGATSPTEAVCAEFLDEVRDHRDRLAGHVTELNHQLRALDRFLADAHPAAHRRQS